MRLPALLLMLLLMSCVGVHLAGAEEAEADLAVLNMKAKLATLSMRVEELSTQRKYDEAIPLAEGVLKAYEDLLGKEHPDTFSSVDALARLYEAQDRYGEAELLFHRVLETRERVLGQEHRDTLTAVNSLAFLYQAQNRYGEAEPLLRRVLEARERVLGRDHPDTLKSVDNLAQLYWLQVRLRDVEPLYQRALDARERVLGPDDPYTLFSVSDLATLYRATGRYAEAEPLDRRVLETRERTLGPDDPHTLSAVSTLATLYGLQGRYRDAEPLVRRVLETREHVLGREHPDTLKSVTSLAMLYGVESRYGEAELLIRRTLETRERVMGREHPDTLDSISSLAELYLAQSRYDEAEPLLRRALQVNEQVLGREHPDTLTSVNNLATLYLLRDRKEEAEAFYRRTLETRERVLGPEHPDTLTSVNNLAHLYLAQKRYGEAEPLYRRALEASERVLGPEHPSTLFTTNGMGWLNYKQGRYAEAEALYRRALEADERVLGQDHPETLSSINYLAELYFTQGRWAKAAQFWRRSTAIIAARTQRGALAASVSGNKKREVEQKTWQFWGLIKAVYRLQAGGRAADAAVSRELFQTAQWAFSSEAAEALAQMAARFAKGEGRLAALVRERQDMLAEWQKRDLLRNAALGEDAAKRDAKTEAENAVRLAAIDARITDIDKRLAAEFPDYATLASPAPVSVEDVQAQLRPDEALVLFLDTPEAKPTPEETFIWVVTRTDVRWVRSDLGTDALTREVQALRCGLDADAWRGSGCARLLGGTYTEADANNGKPLPFDYGRAHALYRALFGQVEDLTRGRHLLIVASGALTQLPFQVLVTAPPANDEGDHKSTAWLVRDHAVSFLPAVSSLKALRRVARPSVAAKPMIGFGNPLLDGDQAHPQYGAYYRKRAQFARDNQQCQSPGTIREGIALSGRSGVMPVDTRGGLASVAYIRMQMPLPETAGELCAVARDLRADVNELRLGARATEREVKALSASGQLAQYRIVHFATHGALAGELKGTSEPGLLLTPPDTASEDDDGYLSASEIAALKLDADWVILSACNTAAGNAEGAQALSGLARAFIYAQARALLVSHWSVDSDATVKLITTTMRELANDPDLGRAEALRRAMIALIDRGKPCEGHPAYWAPFIVVGEGAR